ncbi:MAG: ABC transporter ATP-binding protein [Ilumatobacteraceae bacterium]
MSRVEIRGAQRSFEGREAVRPIHLDIPAGQFVSIIGPSASGKSTLLRMVAGLLTPTAGSVTLDGEPVETARRHKRIAVVPQHPALLPWRTVAENARVLLDVNRRQSHDVRDHGDLLAEVGLAEAADRLPHELSGGMQQRVALVRALALGAPLLLMDEPFAALDELTRAEMRVLVNRLVEGKGVTTVLVTHSISEAVALSDRVLVTSYGPARIIADIAIPLSRPRADAIDDDPSFVSLCAEVRHALHAARLDEAAPAGSAP